MPLTVTTDHSEISAVLDELIALDPVRGTLLGTIRNALEDAAWAAFDDQRLAVRSSVHYPAALSGEWTDAQLPELADLLSSVDGLRGLSGRASAVEPLVELLWPGGEMVRMGQRLFRCDELIPPVDVPGRAERARADEHHDLVRDWYFAFMTEANDVAARSPEAVERAAAEALEHGVCWLWLSADGEPVSLAARRPAIGGSARVGPVYTPPAQRGHGYGSAVTAAATADIAAEGAIPVLFTDLANPISNKIYQLLGYRPVEDRVVVVTAR